MKKCSHSAHETLTELNITPLLDLAFVLLVIFIITTTPIVNDLDLNLPTASKHEKDPPRKANYITVESSGKLWLNKQAVELTDLQPTLAGLRETDPDLSVIVRGDSRTKYKQIRAVLDACQQANVVKVDLATETADKKEAMTPQTQPRKRRNSSRVNLFISLAFHSAIVLSLVYFAAREGLLGKQLKKIAVEMVKEKPPEKPKEPEQPKEEPPKVEPPKVEAARVEAPKAAAPAPAPSVAAPPAVAPPTADVASFTFEGGKAVQTSSDPVQLYKGYVEYALRSKWRRPPDVEDEFYVAEVELAVNRDGRISDPRWKRGSGDSRWDDTVRQAIAATTSLNRPPPANFPTRVLVRFDVQEEVEPGIQ